MRSVIQLATHTNSNVLIAFDWPGSSNAWTSDSAKFAALRTTDTSLNEAQNRQIMDENMRLVKDTAWWLSYTGRVKGTIVANCINNNVPIKLVCIQGGPVSDVERQAMPGLVTEVEDDLCGKQIRNPGISICTYPHFQAFQDASWPLTLMMIIISNKGNIQPEV
jgi:hypothetical protein